VLILLSQETHRALRSFLDLEAGVDDDDDEVGGGRSDDEEFGLSITPRINYMVLKFI
jgi:hypothetical protein